jgi:hypothetical protein
MVGIKLLKDLCGLMNETALHIKNGQIINKAAIKELFASLLDGVYVLKCDAFKKRSNQQNRYYHGCCLPLVKEGLQNIGYREVRTNEDAHEVLKYLFLKKLIPNEETGEVIEILGTTTKLSTTEFNEYIERIIQWASEYLNIQIPLPNEQLEMNLKP